MDLPSIEGAEFPICSEPMGSKTHRISTGSVLAAFTSSKRKLEMRFLLLLDNQHFPELVLEKEFIQQNSNHQCAGGLWLKDEYYWNIKAIAISNF